METGSSICQINWYKKSKGDVNVDKRILMFFCVLILLGTSIYSFFSIKESITAKDVDLIGNTFQSKDYIIEISDDKIYISSKQELENLIGVEHLYLGKDYKNNYNELDKVEYSMKDIKTKRNVYEITLEDGSKFELIKQESGVISDLKGEIFLKKNKWFSFILKRVSDFKSDTLFLWSFNSRKINYFRNNFFPIFVSNGDSQISVT